MTSGLTPKQAGGFEIGERVEVRTHCAFGKTIAYSPGEPAEYAVKLDDGCVIDAPATALRHLTENEPEESNP